MFIYTNYNFNRIHCIYIPNIIENYRVIQVSVVARFCQQFYQNQTFIFYLNFNDHKLLSMFSQLLYSANVSFLFQIANIFNTSYVK